MQLVAYRKHFGLSIALALSASIITPTAQGFLSKKNVTKAAGVSLLSVVLISFIRLVTKTTQPKRVMPASDSFGDQAWYVFDELLVGQIKKDERPNKVKFNPDDMNELIIEYGKVNPRGITGIIYSYMKPAIIPAITFMILFNKDFKEKLIEGIKLAREFTDNPYTPFKDIVDALVYSTYNLPAK